MELYSKLCNGFQQLSIIAKSALLNVWLGPKCISEMYTWKNKKKYSSEFCLQVRNFLFWQRLKEILHILLVFFYMYFFNANIHSLSWKKWLSNLLFAVVEKSNGALVEAFVPNLFKVNNENTRATVKSL